MSRMNYIQTLFSVLMFSINCMDILKIGINNKSVIGFIGENSCHSHQMLEFIYQYELKFSLL